MKWVLAGVSMLVGLSSTSHADAPQLDAMPGHSTMLVVIDPGHGGGNAGAPSVVDGVYEKTVTLAVARRVRAHLEARGVQVELTRDGDTYLSLRQRSRRANELDADVFVSIHANASDRHANAGFETFVLTPRAVEIDAVALRAFEGRPRVGVDPQIARILDDVERGLAVPAAAQLAGDIQRHLRAVRGGERDRGVRQDAMHVLLGATMPSVLVEIGFIDHAAEGHELLDPEVQDAIARALADAIAPRDR